MDASEQLALRPLNIGEIFDRAVTLYVRNFALFTLIMLTIFVPFGVVQYFVAPAQQASLQQLVATIESPATARARRPPGSPFGTYTPEQLAAIFSLILLAALIAPFATNAIAVGVAALYTGRVPRFEACFAAVLRRWLPMIGLLASWFLIAIVAYVATVISLVLLLLIGISFVKEALPIAVIVFIIGAAAVMAIFLIAMMMVVAAAFSFYAVTIEEQPVFAAVGSGFARVFNREEFWKALLLALSYAAIQIGASIIAAGIGLLVLFLTKLTAAEIAVSTVSSALLTAFTTVLIAVYYYDVRIRREGFDLEADVQRLTT